MAGSSRRHYKRNRSAAQTHNYKKSHQTTHNSHSKTIPQERSEELYLREMSQCGMTRQWVTRANSTRRLWLRRHYLIGRHWTYGLDYFALPSSCCTTRTNGWLRPHAAHLPRTLQDRHDEGKGLHPSSCSQDGTAACRPPRRLRTQPGECRCAEAGQTTGALVNRLS
ncbi:hypothetical protein LIA77_07792 [Sarocladium implicatum]|nr:hypothetical protein LIA77_07792 [Sarocladium implicatum]